MTETLKKEPNIEKDKYKIPEWAGRPPAGTHLDVTKSKQLLQKLLIDEKGYYYFGRNPSMCDFVVEHASCSRVHAVLLYHKLLKRFAMVDLESCHGTFVQNVRIEPLTPVFIDFDGTFYFGASTRRYIIKANLSVKEMSNLNDLDVTESFLLPTEELELDNLTEYHTAQNRRIPQIHISVEEARRKTRPRPKLQFADEEDIINPEDVDPSIGRFRNLVRTAVIPITSKTSAKRSRNADQTEELFEFYAPNTKKLNKNHKTDTGKKNLLLIGHPHFRPLSLQGIALNAAPDLDLYSSVKDIPPKSISTQKAALIGPNRPRFDQIEFENQEEENTSKKKYAKEAWPGRKPPIANVL